MQPETIRSHRWEIAGLGVAPFVCTGMTEQRHDMGHGQSKPGGTCDYCGQGILYVFHIRSSDSRRFKVGIDCVLHTHDDAETIVVEVKRVMKAHKRAKRAEGVAVKRKAAAEMRAQQAASERAANIQKLANDPTYRRLCDGSGNEFLAKMKDSMERFGSLTEGQQAAALKVMDRPAVVAASRHIGSIGERVKIAGTVELSRCIYHGSDRYDPDRWMTKIRTQGGAVLTWFGSYGLREGAIQGSATVKAHQEYQGERQTLIANPRWKEVAQ